MVTALGTFSGATISPAIAMVDRAIIENISGKNTQWASLYNSISDFFKNPFMYLKTKKEVRWVFFVYGSTYSAANVTDVTCRKYGIPIEAPKFLIVSAVNVVTTAIKDRALARLFGTKAPTAVPPICLGIFALRDSLTIMFSFIVPPIIVNRAEEKGYGRKKTEVVAQFLSPILL